MRRPSLTILVGATVLALVVLIVSACDGGTNSGSDTDTDDSLLLEGKSWRATTIAGVESVLEGRELLASAKFAGGQITGSATINRYNAPYTTGPGNTIEIGLPASTAMAGPEDAMAQEEAYLAAIQKAVTYQVTEDSLSLVDDQGEILVEFEAIAATALIDVEWQAIAYSNGKGGLQSLAADSTITATFGEDSILAGNASVNQYNTTYSISVADPNQMTISPEIATTRMAGPDELMAQESAYLAALPQTAMYEIEGDTLWLRDAQGAALAQYIAE